MTENSREFKVISVSIEVLLCDAIDKITGNRSGFLCNAAADKIHQQEVIDNAVADYAAKRAKY